MQSTNWLFCIGRSWYVVILAPTAILSANWMKQHDKIGVEEASVEISNLMRAKPHVRATIYSRL